MSKANLPDGENLEAIFANIRKTLADPPSDQGLSKLDAGEPAPAADAKGGESGAAPKANGSQNPGKLAGALNGAGKGAADEELTDLLASDMPAAAAPKADATGRDPLWFLSRTQAEEDSAGAPQREEPRTEDIKLTRPETLRRSFPPLFGGGETPQSRPLDVPVERVKPADPANARALRQDMGFAGKPFGEGAKDPPAATPVKFEPIKPEPKAPAVAEPTVASGVGAVAAEPAGAGKIEPVLSKAEPVVAKAEPVVAKAEPVVAITPKPAEVAKEVAREAPVGDGKDADVAPVAEAKAAAADAAGQQGQSLQDVIGRLLEPVIQQWLDSNLPRMVEAAIREEVSRQVKSRGD